MSQQPTQFSCGPTCAQQLLRELDEIDVDLADLLYEFVDGHGMTAEAFVTNLNRHSNRWERLDYTTLDELGEHLANLNESVIVQRGGHFLILDGIENGIVTLRNPAHGGQFTRPVGEIVWSFSEVIFRR